MLGLAACLGALALFPAQASQTLRTSLNTGNIGAGDPGRDLGLPKILGPKDIERYRRIFELQERGDWKTADKLIAALDDELLLGHVQFQRYMHPRKYRSRYRELKAWLAKYADHPGAVRVHKLALHRKPGNYRSPRAPVGPRSARQVYCRTRRRRVRCARPGSDLRSSTARKSRRAASATV